MTPEEIAGEPFPSCPEEDIEECGVANDGLGCTKAGTEWCEWDCPLGLAVAAAIRGKE